MAHTISKHLYCEQEKKFIQCEVLVLDDEDMIPNTDKREIILSCPSCGSPYSELSDQTTSDIDDSYPETALIDQYEDFDNRSGD